MVNSLNMENYLRICREAGFGLHNILAWFKNNCTPSRWYMKNAEYIIFPYTYINIHGTDAINPPINDKKIPTITFPFFSFNTFSITG